MVLPVQDAAVSVGFSMECAGKRKEDTFSTQNSHRFGGADGRILTAIQIKSKKEHSAMINQMKATPRMELLLGRIARPTYLMSVVW